MVSKSFKHLQNPFRRMTKSQKQELYLQFLHEESQGKTKIGGKAGKRGRGRGFLTFREWFLVK